MHQEELSCHLIPAQYGNSFSGYLLFFWFFLLEVRRFFLSKLSIFFTTRNKHHSLPQYTPQGREVEYANDHSVFFLSFHRVRGFFIVRPFEFLPLFHLRFRRFFSSVPEVQFFLLFLKSFFQPPSITTYQLQLYSRSSELVS